MGACIVDSRIFFIPRVRQRRQKKNTPRNTHSMEKGLTLTNFEPNAVIRGFQLTVVGSMFLLLFLRKVESSGAALFLCRGPNED
jgi:hypothetical protein